MSEKKYILGIHNYCERWCERCAFTARCRVFASDPSNIEGLPDNPDSPEFWDQLRNHFQDALEMLHDIAGELKASDMENEDDDEPPETFITREKPERGIHDAYSDAVEDFFQANEAYFLDQETGYEEKVQMGIPVDVERLGFLQEALQTIRWFQHFIYPKIDRAISDVDMEPDSPDDLQSDGNGSSKVAMIAIQRSADAWTFVQQIFPEKKEEINHLLQELHISKEKVEKAFPHWAKFHRPGFDDEPDTVIRLDYHPN